MPTSGFNVRQWLRHCPCERLYEEGGVCGKPLCGGANFYASAKRLHAERERERVIRRGAQFPHRFRKSPPNRRAPLRSSPATRVFHYPPIRDITDPRVGCVTGTTAQRQAAIAACPPIRGHHRTAVRRATGAPDGGKPQAACEEGGVCGKPLCGGANSGDNRVAVVQPAPQAGKRVTRFGLA